MTVEERFDFLEFRQELLFDNTEYSRLLFEYRVTKEQNQAIIDVFQDFRNKIDNGESVHHGSFEERIYEIVPQHHRAYHFAEFLALDNHKRGRWEEVFEALYGDAPKLQCYMQKQR